MSTTTLDVPAAAGTSKRRTASFRALLSLVWRQERAATVTGAVVGVVGTVGLVWLGLAMRAHLARWAASGCVADDGTGCPERYYEMTSRFDWLFQMGSLVLFVVPLLVGVFVGAPSMAREYENGTLRLVLTQEVRPLRWFAAKFSVPAVLVTAVTGVLGATYLWAWKAGTGLPIGAHWYRQQIFDAIGPVPAAHALLVLAVGMLLGVAIRRTIPAMAATAALGIAVLAAFAQLRPWLLRPITESPQLREIASDTWTVEVGALTRSGEHLPAGFCGFRSRRVVERCLAEKDVIGGYRLYHPPSHQWPLIWIETGLALALAAALVGAAFWWVRRRHR